MRHFALLVLSSLMSLYLSAGSHAAQEKSSAAQQVNSEQLANSLSRNGNLESAISVLREAARQPDAPVSAHIKLASALRKIGNHSEAISALREARSKHPGNTEVLNQLGIALISAGHPEEAVNVFDQLIAMQPDNAMAYSGKAVAFDTAGNHVAAQEIYEKALALDPTSLPIRNNIAMSMILNNQFDEAIALLEKLRKENGNNAKIRQNLALAYGMKGESKRALEISLRDLPQDKAEENIHFYERYSQRKRAYKPVELISQDGQPVDDLSGIPPADSPKLSATPVSAIAPAAGLPADGGAVAMAEEEKPAEEETSNQDKPFFFGADMVYSYPSQ